MTKLSLERCNPYLLTPDRSPTTDQRMNATQVQGGEPTGVWVRNRNDPKIAAFKSPTPAWVTKLRNKEHTAQQAGSSTGWSVLSDSDLSLLQAAGMVSVLPGFSSGLRLIFPAQLV